MSEPSTRFETRLGRVRGLGAGGGTHHWWMQRLGSLALVPLSVWLVVSLVTLPAMDYEVAQMWLAQPMTAILMLLFVNVSLWHTLQGLQVVIEDYVHQTSSKITALVTLRFGVWFLMAIATFSILKLAFTV